METDTGNSPKASPVAKADAKPNDRRIPLRVVVFNSATSVPGLGSMVTCVEVGEWRMMGGKSVRCPRPFLDPVNRIVIIEGREYPLERIHYWERDQTGFMPKAKELPDHTIGKKAR